MSKLPTSLPALFSRDLFPGLEPECYASRSLFLPGFFSRRLDLSYKAMLGLWTVRALYGHGVRAFNFL